ncbi:MULTISPECIES: hypothetical protein [Arthrobacter]|uniref:YCII-related domain-containing protein n=2 Tax=Arthrobacter TaxID=1663 RepID=A0ABU9KM54_9MICC|nr:hypothetical protein [Arthrobacter sp. YJM1]MDP5227096.1 hypothetical protein [Arthrobacter sp. YJM1]
MSLYIIYFNQQWVGDHSPEWFASRGPMARAVVEEAKTSGVLVAAAGVDEDASRAFTADATSGALEITSGLFAPKEQYIGGLTVVDVPDDETAIMWAGKIAVACGWPQQLRRLY